mgnify:CR=1 FL=1
MRRLNGRERRCDPFVGEAGAEGRLTESVELALKLGDGTVLIDPVDGSEPVVMSERLVSWEHGITLPPLEPRLFSFNSPHGACPVCDGESVSESRNTASQSIRDRSTPASRPFRTPCRANSTCRSAATPR